MIAEPPFDIVALKELVRELYHGFDTRVEPRELQIDVKVSAEQETIQEYTLYDGFAGDGYLELKNKVRNELLGQGIGRLLVEARETLCMTIDITHIVIGMNENPPFWAHFGYRNLEAAEIASFRERGCPIDTGMTLYREPMVKEL